MILHCQLNTITCAKIQVTQFYLHIQLRPRYTLSKIKGGTVVMSFRTISCQNYVNLEYSLPKWTFWKSLLQLAKLFKLLLVRDDYIISRCGSGAPPSLMWFFSPSYFLLFSPSRSNTSKTPHSCGALEGVCELEMLPPDATTFIRQSLKIASLMFAGSGSAKWRADLYRGKTQDHANNLQQLKEWRLESIQPTNMNYASQYISISYCQPQLQWNESSNRSLFCIVTYIWEKWLIIGEVLHK